MNPIFYPIFAEENSTTDNSVGFFTWILFFGILIFDFALNTYQLLSQSIRLDEAQSLWASTKPISGILSYLSLDVAAPLYAVLLHFWIQIFGPDIVYARILSLAFFLITLPVLYLMAKESGNKKVAMLTVTLFSLSPFIMWYTSEARMYTLFTLITSINHLFFLRTLRTGGKKGAAGYFISTALGLYTHYFFIFLLITQFTYIVFIWFLEAIYNKREGGSFLQQVWEYRNFPFSIIKLMILGVIFFLPWIIFVIAQGSASSTQPLIPHPTTFNIFQAFVNFLFGFQANGVQGLLISLWPLVIIFLFFIFTQRRRSLISNIGYFVMATFFPIVVDFLASYIRPIFLSRYLILITPTLFFILSWLIINNSKKVASLLTGTVIVIMFGLMLYQNVSASTPVKEDYRGVSAYMEKNVKSGDIIVASAPFTIYPIEYTYHSTTRIDTIPEWSPYSKGAIPAYSTPNLAKQVKKYTTVYNRMFVVLSYDQGYQHKIVDYLDKHYKRNDLIKFSPGLEVRVYQLRY